jgi:hypothetical protein
MNRARVRKLLREWWRVEYQNGWQRKVANRRGAHDEAKLLRGYGHEWVKVVHVCVYRLEKR